MRPFLTMFTIVALPASCVLAQDNRGGHGPQSAGSFETLNKEYENASKTWSAELGAAYEQAKKNGKEKGFPFDKPSPNAHFSPRFLLIAEKNPEGPDAIDALKMTLRTSSVPRSATVLETRAKAIRILRDYYAAKPPIMGFLKIVAQYSDDDSKALVALVIACNPDREVQLAAYKEQIRCREDVVLFADIFKDPKRRDGVEKGFIEERIARAERAKSELEGLRKTRREKYSDLYTDLSIGYPAPDLKIRALDGKEAKLSALKGKVVVLDIWATWCGFCREMIPHEREMVERLKDKPFALVSISVDEKKETLTDFLAREKMPWTHWWNGSEGGIITDWDVRSYPTIYVLDTQGVIRYKDIRGEELEKAVNVLLAEETKITATRSPK